MTIRADQPAFPSIFCGFTMAMACVVIFLWIFNGGIFKNPQPLDCSPPDTYIE